MKVSGKARYYVDVTTVDELIEALSWAKERELPNKILAGGSNIIIACEEFNGLVIKININTQEVHNNTITASAGTPMNRLLLLAKENSLDGLSPFSGLPGTVGGAVRGNAGCYGRETQGLLTNVTILNEDLEIEEVRPNDMGFKYRHSRIKDNNEIILSATYELTPSDPGKIQEDYITILKKRIAQQAKGFSSGSFFKNPTPGKVYAGALIEQAGLKGHKDGGMIVSEHHANYLVNTGDATWEDVLHIKKFVTDKIAEQFSIVLAPEVSIITE